MSINLDRLENWNTPSKHPEPCEQIVLPHVLREHAETHSLSIDRVEVGSVAYNKILSIRSKSYRIALGSSEDEIDEHSILYLVRQSGNPVATIRVTYARMGPIDCEGYFPVDIIKRFRPVLCSASRFCSLPGLSPELKISQFLIHAAWGEAVSCGIRLDLIDVNAKAVRYYQRLGYVLVPGFRFVHPALGTQSEVMMCSVDSERPGSLRSVFEECTDPLPLSSVWNCLGQVQHSESRECPVAPRDSRMVATIPSPGSVISFSAGSDCINPDKYRCVRSQSEKFARLVSTFPVLSSVFSGITPLVVNCYPAPIGQVSGAVLVDTYGRTASFSNALELAHGSRSPVVVVGMPLALAQLLLRHLQLGYRYPRKLVLFVGGYSCPISLEQFMRGLLESLCVSCEIVHLYGVAELDSALLAAMDRDSEGVPVFRSIDDQWLPIVSDGKLGFVNSHAEDSSLYPTGDHARMVGDGYAIRNSSVRMCEKVESLFQSWRAGDWYRRTGFLWFGEDGIRMQLRRGFEPIDVFEISFEEYLMRVDSSWFEKPCWSSRVKLDPSAANTRRPWSISCQ